MRRLPKNAGGFSASYFFGYARVKSSTTVIYGLVKKQKSSKVAHQHFRFFTCFSDKSEGVTMKFGVHVN